MERKIAFFDIDNTLIYGDSLFSLYKYGCRKWKRYYFLLPAIPVFTLAYHLHIIPRVRMKEIFYKPLEKFGEKEYDEFFDNYILGNKIENTFKELYRVKREGYFVLMVTASPYAYMRLFKERGYADDVIGTTVENKNGVYTGKIIGENCAKEEKVKRIKKLLKQKDIQIDYENSVGYSDSDKDIPMLSLCKSRTRVLKNGELTEFVEKRRK